MSLLTLKELQRRGASQLGACLWRRIRRHLSHHCCAGCVSSIGKSKLARRCEFFWQGPNLSLLHTMPLCPTLQLVC